MHLFNALKEKELRLKLLVVFLVFIAYKVVSIISMPIIDRTLLGEESLQAIQLLDRFGGRMFGFVRFFELGITPYITVSILVGLLSAGVIKSWTEWSKQGELGKKKIKRVTYVITYIVALLQAVGVMMTMEMEATNFGIITNLTAGDYLKGLAIMLVGLTIMLVLAEIIENKGLGNGVSIIIVAGLIASLTNEFRVMLYNSSSVQEFFSGNNLLMIVISLVLFIVVLFFETATRDIPVEHTSRLSEEVPSKHLPIKFNIAGVEAVIFTGAIYIILDGLSSLMTTYGNVGVKTAGVWLSDLISTSSISGVVIYFVLTYIMAFSYAKVQVDPEKTANDLMEAGTYIRGVRPGKETENYLRDVINRITLFSGLYLSLISVLPMVIAHIFGVQGQFTFLGTGVIILVGVLVDFFGKWEGYGLKYSLQRILPEGDF